MPPMQTPQVNPALLAVLRARAGQAVAPGGGGGVAAPMPTGMNGPVAPAVAAPQVNAAPRATGTPAQAAMKTAAAAQSPMMDPGTRGAAKNLILQLMKHM